MRSNISEIFQISEIYATSLTNNKSTNNYSKKMGFVKTEISPEGIARISFFHPNQNSLPSSLLADLVGHFQAAGKNDDVNLIILESAVLKTFCAGADFDELMAIEDFETGLSFFSGFGNIINAMRKCGKIIVGRIHGKAVGGGVGLAAACDYCFASKYASFRLSELAVGFGPFVIGPAVERRIGLTAFTELALTPAVWRTPNFGKEKGLFQEVFETVDEMDKHLNEFCQILAGYSPDALGELKRIFWEDTGLWDDLLAERAAVSGRLCLSDFSKNAIAAFKLK